MKKVGTALAILILSGLVAAPVFAGGMYYYCPYGSGPGNYGPGTYGPGNYGPNPYVSNITPEQREQMDKLTKAFFDETDELRKNLWTKSRDLDALMAASAPDEAKAMALQKEISDLKATLSQKRLEYQLQVKKIVPDADFPLGPGPRHGRGPEALEQWVPPVMGYGPGYSSRDWGRNYHRPMMQWGGGHGYGPCWY